MRLIFVLFAVLSLVGCNKRPDAPFGLEWGQNINSLAELKLKKFKCTEKQDIQEQKITECTFRYVPEAAEWIDIYSASFINEQLVEINAYMSSRNGYGDNDFSSFNIKFNNAISDLSREYGKPVEQSDVSITCDNEDNCDGYRAEYKKDGIKIDMSIHKMPFSSDLTMMINYKPEK
ncbi:hypothetical protein [Xenorhabdus stockiae]|uniref:hypothetical protein n=1 Tax=Xenorhabdus stockiae TaxID=351614 RepID=UPI0040644907